MGVAISICSSASCNRSHICLQWYIRSVVIIPILHLQLNTSIVDIEQPDDRNTQNVHSNSTRQSLKLNNQMIETHKMYIDYVITIISTSNFYISKTSVSTSISPMTCQMPPCHSAPRGDHSSTCLYPTVMPSTCRHTTRTGPDRGRIGGSGAWGLVGSCDGVLGEGVTDFIGDNKVDF
jgi:hypothetical protein